MHFFFQSSSFSCVNLRTRVREKNWRNHQQYLPLTPRDLIQSQLIRIYRGSDLGFQAIAAIITFKSFFRNVLVFLVVSLCCCRYEKNRCSWRCLVVFSCCEGKSPNQIRTRGSMSVFNVRLLTESKSNYTSPTSVDSNSVLFFFTTPILSLYFSLFVPDQIYPDFSWLMLFHLKSKLSKTVTLFLPIIPFILVLFRPVSLFSLRAAFQMTKGLFVRSAVGQCMILLRPQHFQVKPEKPSSYICVTFKHTN